VQELTGHPSVVPVLRFFERHPAVVPVVLVLVAVALLGAVPLARRLGCGRLWAALLLFAATAPVAMTLLPDPEAGADPVRECLTGLRPLSDWGRGGEELANLVLLAPLGLLLVVLLPRRAAVVALLVAAVSPVLVEVVQFAVPALGRTCETTDVALNLVGLLAGALAGLPVRWARRARRERR
jgi:VanZ family protein